ncbi:MAG: hypothetical protein JWQ30_33, partial [Sediminibacterium sp.]|nr:hypothetical protein [Sediminibacterium sp.]
DKIVMIVIESADCKQCNEMTTQSFTNPVLSRSVNSNCIAMKINRSSKEYAMIDSIYSTNNSMAILFLEYDGTLLQKFTASSTSYMAYVDQLNKALTKKEHPDTEFKELVKDYNSGKREFELLYKLVKKKAEAGLEHDLLTEEMLSLAPQDSATSLTFIQFLAEQAPVFDSKVYQYMYKNSQNFRDAWFMMSQQKRTNINNRMVSKSRAKAVKEKNRIYAERVANMFAGTYTEKIVARKVHDRVMIDYFRGVKDTANFLVGSVRYYDQYLMTISLDSVQHIDSIRKSEIPQRTLTPPPDAARMETAVMAYVSGTGPVPTGIFIPIAQNYTNELNSGSWTIYTFTHDPVYTAKALAWAKRANEFSENPAVMDTYARLLYRTGNKKEAIVWEDKAVQYTKARKIPASEYEEIVNKMRAGKDPIDEY